VNFILLPALCKRYVIPTCPHATSHMSDLCRHTRNCNFTCNINHGLTYSHTLSLSFLPPSPHDDGCHHNTENHCREQLLAGWERCHFKTARQRQHHHQAKRNNNTTMELQETTEQRGGGKANGKRPQRHQTMSLGPFTSFFFTFASFFVVANDLF
jgi:hypothetical protein